MGTLFTLLESPWHPALGTFFAQSQPHKKRIALTAEHCQNHVQYLFKKITRIMYRINHDYFDQSNKITGEPE
jgi:hypothetical protein